MDQPEFFDVIKHQLFYFQLLSNKTDHSSSWFPGLSRLGDNNLVPENPVRPVHRSSVSNLKHANILLQFITIIVVLDDISRMFNHLSVLTTISLVVFIFWTAYSFGLQYDENYYAFPVEFTRQPVLEGVGWLTHCFYLPLAFFIPTSSDYDTSLFYKVNALQQKSMEKDFKFYKLISDSDLVQERAACLPNLAMSMVILENRKMINFSTWAISQTCSNVVYNIEPTIKT